MVHDHSERVDLAGANPNDLLMAPLADLLVAVRAMKQADWAGRAAEVVDHVYRHRIARLLAQRPDEGDLTPRESEVLRLIEAGS